MSFRFLHAADLHLDTPFRGVGRLDERLATRLRDASLEAWDALVRAALQAQVSFVVLAGDIYDGPKRGLRAQVRFHAGLERLAAAGIRVFICHGNHDPVGSDWTAIDRWPDGVTLFGSDTVEAVHFEAPDGTPIVVHGISFGRPAETDNLALRFPAAPAGCFSVAVLHANVGDQPGHSPYSPCQLDDLHRTGHDYWALGHVHRRRVLSDAPCVAYPGNLQGRSFAPGERGAKGALLVEVEGDRIAPTFLALDRARFVEVDLDVTDLGDLIDVVGALEEAVEAAADPGEQLVLARARLRGRSPLAARLREDDVLPALQARGGPVWVDLDVQVAGEVDVDALRDGGDVRATLVRLFDDLADDPDELRALMADITPRGLRRTQATLDDAALRALLEEAALDALARLET